jgi:putative ABC transport system substrate-binding protein
VDRIFRGEKAEESPGSGADEYQLIVNLKTARAPVISVPPWLLGTADEVIE